MAELALYWLLTPIRIPAGFTWALFNIPPMSWYLKLCHPATRAAVEIRLHEIKQMLGG